MDSEDLRLYKTRYVGTEAELDEKYGAEQLKRPAFVRTGRYIDTGILAPGKGPVYNYQFDCRSAIQVLNCLGQVIWGESIGTTYNNFNLAKVQQQYTEAQAEVYGKNPCPESYIDLRTLAQLRLDCCPTAVMFAMLT